MLGGNLYRVDGVADILRRFAKFDKSVQRQYLGAAVTATVKPHIPEVKAFTPVGPTGNLRRSVGAKTEKYRRKNSASATAILGYRSGGSSKQHKGFHAWLVDAGTTIRQPIRSQALRIPAEWAFRSKGSLAPLVTRLGRGKNAEYEVDETGLNDLFFKYVQGIKGTNRFRRWADANLPKLRNELVRNLEVAVEKAAAQQARRDARAAQGKSNR